MKDCYTVKLTERYIAIADLIEYNGGRMITRINIPRGFRRQGNARMLLDRILRDADSEGVALHLDVSPSDGLSYNQLVAWYQRHGFVFTDEGLMMRQSRG